MRASASATAATRASSPANGTASLISPHSAASTPVSGVPVSACHFAFASPSR